MARVERELGPIDLLCANAGTTIREGGRSWEADVTSGGACSRSTCSACTSAAAPWLPGMIERGSGRIVITGSGASYLPGLSDTAYSASKAAVGRYGENLARQLQPYGIPVFVISPGLVRSAMTASAASRTMRRGRRPSARRGSSTRSPKAKLDRLSGRYIHAEHDDPDDLAGRIDEVLENDLNAIRLRR